MIIYIIAHLKGFYLRIKLERGEKREERYREISREVVLILCMQGGGGVGMRLGLLSIFLEAHSYLEVFLDMDFFRSDIFEKD